MIDKEVAQSVAALCRDSELEDLFLDPSSEWQAVCRMQNTLTAVQCNHYLNENRALMPM